MKIGLVGYGYWGRILLKNIESLVGDRCDITICEKLPTNQKRYKVVKDYKQLECDMVFVAVPSREHYEICKYFLQKGVDVFCEKPLTLDTKSSSNLYEIATENGARLFVDWVFVYNPCVQTIKEVIKNYGKPKNIIFNRLNYGPAREDTTARWDLCSHDVSIALYLLGERPTDVRWLDFSRNKKSKQFDSSTGVLTFSDTTVQINSSWEYGKKDRLCSMEIGDKFLYWDDIEKSVIFGIDNCEVSSYSPLEKSIDVFLNDSYNHDKQKELTLQTIRILENEGCV
jgi:predicted dehydrogenase